MRDVLDILAAVSALPAGEPFTLATVVRVRGSSYRSPGARMLVDAAGRRVGSVSGGCLESDVARRGRLLTADHPAELVRYDGTDEDAAWGFGLGCNGSIDVLIERCVGDERCGLAFIRERVTTRTNGVMVTVFAGPAFQPGTRLLRSGTTVVDPSGLGRELDLSDVDRPTVRTTGNRLHALVEPIRPPLPLVIFGAGHDAVPLVAVAKRMGWHVTVWDRRAGHARRERFPTADAVVSSDVADALRTTGVTADSVAVVMNHYYPADAELVGSLLQRPIRYLGVLGPRARTDRMLNGRPTPAAVHAPVGLDIGADGPEQVAVSVVAEILAALSRRSGAPLRSRDGPIHNDAMG